MTLRSLAVAGALCVPGVLAAQIGGTTLSPSQDVAPSRVATRGANFLELGVGGRALALAGAYAATASDLSAAYWNVSGLADVQAASGYLSHERLYGNSGLRNNYLAAALPAFGGVVGVSFTSFSSGAMQRTTEAWPDGGDPTFGNTVEWRASSIGLHYARRFTDRLTAGLTGKYATEGMEFAKADYVGADVGVRFNSGLYGTTLGMAIANLGSRGRVSGPAIRRALAPRRDPLFPTQRTLDSDLRPNANQMPTMLRVAVQTELVGTTDAVFGGQGGAHRLTMFGDINDGMDTDIMPALAAEYALYDRVAFRIGKRFLRDQRTTDAGTSGFSAGAGVRLPIGGRRVLVDYAYRSFGDLDANHVFSFELGK